MSDTPGVTSIDPILAASGVASSMEIDRDGQFQLYAAQDQLIVYGITLLSNRLNEFYAMIKANGLDFPEPFRKAQQAW